MQALVLGERCSVGPDGPSDPLASLWPQPPALPLGACWNHFSSALGQSVHGPSRAADCPALLITFFFFFFFASCLLLLLINPNPIMGPWERDFREKTLL